MTIESILVALLFGVVLYAPFLPRAIKNITGKDSAFLRIVSVIIGFATLFAMTILVYQMDILRPEVAEGIRVLFPFLE